MIKAKRYNYCFDTKKIELKKYDLLVVGAGLAGLSAAVSAYRENPEKSILVITRARLNTNSSNLAQGGIACPLGPGDSIKLHVKDTVRTGRGLTDKRVAESIIREGVKTVKQLIAEGFEFDKENGKTCFGREGAHSLNRVLHVKGDQTGRFLHKYFLGKAKKNSGIHFMENTNLQEILTNKKTFYGAIIEEKGKQFIVKSNSIVLAVGGYSNLFGKSTNPKGSNGDAISIAFRAGCNLKGLEFEQFHPTVFFNSEREPFLVSEAVRGEGAILVNRKGKHLFENFKMGSLLGRDIISKVLFEREKNNKKSFLNATMFSEQEFKKRFPTIHKTLLKNNIYPSKNLIPISPAAHYSIGGIKTDLNGKTNVKGIYAAGECTCTGFHGANRLASNSLLEALVMGKKAGINAVKEKPKRFFYKKFFFKGKKESPAKLLEQYRKLQKTMWNYCGIIRTKKSLKKAFLTAKKIYLYAWNYKGQKSAILRDRALLAMKICNAAIKRKKSIGCHQIIS